MEDLGGSRGPGPGPGDRTGEASVSERGAGNDNAASAEYPIDSLVNWARYSLILQSVCSGYRVILLPKQAGEGTMQCKSSI